MLIEGNLHILKRQIHLIRINKILINCLFKLPITKMIK